MPKTLGTATLDCAVQDGLERGMSKKGDQLGVYCMTHVGSDKGFDLDAEVQNDKEVADVRRRGQKKEKTTLEDEMAGWHH